MQAQAMPLDAADLRRIRWRSRRGLLENDLILSRFFEQCADGLNLADWQALQGLLELDDNALLDLLLGHTELPIDMTDTAQARLLHRLRAA